MALSTFCGATNLPPEVLKRSFLRSVILTWPVGVISAMSPVWYQPSASSASAVSSGRLWYPGVMMGPRSSSSPSSASFRSMPGRMGPTVPKCGSRGRSTPAMALVSVAP